MRPAIRAWGLAPLVVAMVTWSPVQADFQLKTDREASEVVESLTVRIDVGAQGGDLQEPVALDLGLGFPFWLHPVGRSPAEPAPFGAIPQQTTAGTKVAAGSSATFTFVLEGEAGQDVLGTTPQLLAGVQVSDLARIAFASQGTNDWVLAGYEIQLNGQTFASNDKVDVKAKEAQDDARFRLADLGLQTAPLEQEFGDLSALAQTQLASSADLARLVEVEQQLAPLQVRKRWLEGQVRGEYPWFEQAGFSSPWRQGATVGSLGAILVTDTHPGADTNNYVYFRSGGHKYLLGSPGEPLSGQLGPQEFSIDLLAGPLTAADMRGYAVGMLAHAQPYGSAPDRWHPRRILIGVDGRLVYDSDQSPIDMNSLEAIRVISPAHLDAQGQVVKNVPTDRETFLWEAGMGIGLDQAGGVLPLPPPGEPGFDPFPGEVIICPDGGNWPGWDPAWPAPPLWIDWVFGWLLPDLGIWPPWPDPPPVGDPFQIETVAITSGWKYDDTFILEWAVAGDEGPIDHYEVSLVEIDPAIDPPLQAAVVSATVAAGSRDHSFTLPAPMVGAPRYLAPMVVAVPSDPAITPHERIGPAKAVFPTGTDPASQPLLQNVYNRTTPPLLGITSHSVSFGGQPPASGRAVWAAGEVESHNGILFDNASPGWNIGVRPENLTDPVGGPPPSMTILEQVVDKADAAWAGDTRLLIEFAFENGAVDPAHPPALFGLRIIPEP